jgi:hypothetical protein
MLCQEQWSSSYVHKLPDWWTLESKKKIILLNGHPQPLLFLRKKNGAIRVVSDFRKLNSLLKHHPFPIPKIGDMIRSLEGFTFATALGYYHTTPYLNIIHLPYQRLEA